MGRKKCNHKKLLIVFATQKLGLLFYLKFLLQYNHLVAIVKKRESLVKISQK